MNLIEGLQSEMNRCRELLKQYEAIGPAGRFGKSMIEADIIQGEAAIASGDGVEMLFAYKRLKRCE